ncbi:MAG: SufE family protein [Anaerolineales bacterium]|nr:SufE family protein [Anaerolineales bacterium]
MTPEEIAEDFSWLDSWDDRYGYLIDLGRQLPPMEMADKTEENRIEGCQSGVWIRMDVGGESPVTLNFVGDSDSAIVKGLVAIVLSLVNGRSPQHILDLDIRAFFTQLNLENHLSPTRKTGLNEMVKTIKARANALLEVNES